MSGVWNLGSVQDSKGNTHYLSMLVSGRERFIYLTDKEGNELDQRQPENRRSNLLIFEEPTYICDCGYEGSPAPCMEGCIGHLCLLCHKPCESSWECLLTTWISKACEAIREKEERDGK